jgi:hypothetical protein
MSKKGQGYGGGTFLLTKLYLSPAFISLGSCAKQMLIMLYGKRQFGTRKDRKGKKVFERTDNNQLILTYKELEAIGFTQPRATRGIDELLCKGFISIYRKGGAYDKDKSIYSLEDDYLRWRPEDDPIRVRPQDPIKRGFCKPKKGMN